MNRWIQILSISFMQALASAVTAQTPVTCGIVEIVGLSTADAGTQLVFMARVSSMPHTWKSEFKWKVSAGTITSGQATDVITVDTSGISNQEVTATLELTGAPSDCKSSASTTTQIKPVISCWLPFDEYGDIKFEDEKARLDNFAIQIFNEPQSRGLILMAAGQKTFESEAASRLDRARKYLVNARGLDPKRIITTDCGFTQDLTAILWVVPPDLTPRDCSGFTQVPRSEVKFTKRRPKTLKKRR